MVNCSARGTGDVGEAAARLPEPAIAREKRFEHVRDEHGYGSVFAMKLAVNPRIVFKLSGEGWFDQNRQLLQRPIGQRSDLHVRPH